MKFAICVGFASLICFHLISQCQTELADQRWLSWEIAKLEYLQRKVQTIADTLTTGIELITNAERAILQAAIDALRRMGGMNEALRTNRLINEEELLKLFDDCENLIRKYESIERKTGLAQKSAERKDSVERIQ